MISSQTSLNHPTKMKIQLILAMNQICNLFLIPLKVYILPNLLKIRQKEDQIMIQKFSTYILMGFLFFKGDKKNQNKNGPNSLLVFISSLNMAAFTHRMGENFQQLFDFILCFLPKIKCGRLQYKIYSEPSSIRYKLPELFASFCLGCYRRCPALNVYHILGMSH